MDLLSAEARKGLWDYNWKTHNSLMDQYGSKVVLYLSVWMRSCLASGIDISIFELLCNATSDVSISFI